MMLEPPDSLAASYRLVPLIDTDMVMVLSEWSKESSCGRIKTKYNASQATRLQACRN